MILRSLLATWIYFQVVTIFKWDPTFYTQGQQVESQLVNEETKFSNLFDADLMSECVVSSRQSACAVCECTTGLGVFVNSRSTQCEVSEDVLQSLHALILEAFNKIMYGFRSSYTRKAIRRSAADEDSCDGLVDNCRNSSLLPHSSKKVGSNEDCDALLEEMQEKMYVIIEQLELLLDFIEDPGHLLEKIAQLQNCVQCLEETIDVVVKEASKEIVECYEASLGNVYTCFATRLNERTKKIQELETLVTSKTINAIVSNVLASRYIEAAIEYRDLRNASLFDTMMNDMYKSRQLEHILHFGRALHHNNITGRANVYMKLMGLMNASQQIDTNEIVFSSFVARDRIEFCSKVTFCFEDGLPFDFANLTRYSKPQVDKVLDKWTISVRNKNYKSLLLFGSPEKVNFSGKAFHDVIEQLVGWAYDGNANYLSNTLDFVSDLKWNNQSYTGFKCLLVKAIRFDDKLKIAIRMKERMENLVGPDENVVVVRRLFDDLAKSLPDNVRGLAFSETCVLGVDETNFLFAEGSFYQGGNRKINTRYKPTDTNYDYKWQFEKVERGLNAYEFRIKNFKNGEYLGSHIPWKYDSHSHDICATSMPEYFEPPRKFYNWQVHFNGISEGDKIFLYHVGRRAYLGDRRPLLDMWGGKDGKQLVISCE